MDDRGQILSGDNSDDGQSGCFRRSKRKIPRKQILQVARQREVQFTRFIAEKDAELKSLRERLGQLAEKERFLCNEKARQAQHETNLAERQAHLDEKEFRLSKLEALQKQRDEFLTDRETSLANKEAILDERNTQQTEQEPEVREYHQYADKGFTICSTPGAESEKQDHVIRCLHWTDGNEQPQYKAVQAEYLERVTKVLSQMGIQLRLTRCAVFQNDQPEGATAIIIPCLAISRVESCLTTALKRVPATDKHRCLVVVFHPRAPHDARVPKSRQQVSTEMQTQCDLMVDVVFNRQSGFILPTQENQEASREVVDCLLGHIPGCADQND